MIDKAPLRTDALDDRVELGEELASTVWSCRQLTKPGYGFRADATLRETLRAAVGGLKAVRYLIELPTNWTWSSLELQEESWERASSMANHLAHAITCLIAVSTNSVVALNESSELKDRPSGPVTGRAM